MSFHSGRDAHKEWIMRVPSTLGSIIRFFPIANHNLSIISSYCCAGLNKIITINHNVRMYWCSVFSIKYPINQVRYPYMRLSKLLVHEKDSNIILKTNVQPKHILVSASFDGCTYVCLEPSFINQQASSAAEANRRAAWQVVEPVHVLLSLQAKQKNQRLNQWEWNWIQQMEIRSYVPYFLAIWIVGISPEI